MKAHITAVLGAYLVFAIGAGAQAQPNVPPVTASPEPRFKIEANGIRASNEDGFDWPWTDHVKVLIMVPAYKTETSTEELSVDAGWWITVISDRHGCILPIAGYTPKPDHLFTYFDGDEKTWSCSDDGARGPFSFRVRVHKMTFGCNYAPACEPLLQRTISYSMEELLGLRVGQVLVERIRLLVLPCPPGVDVCQSTDAEYVFEWRITRLPDARPVLNQ